MAARANAFDRIMIICSGSIACGIAAFECTKEALQLNSLSDLLTLPSPALMWGLISVGVAVTMEVLQRRGCFD